MENVLLAACWLALTMIFHSMSWLDVPSDPAGPFLLRMGLAWVAWGLAGLLVYRGKVKGRWLVPAILLGGALLRGVAWNVPILLETDVHRYLWDGYVLSEGFNPYQFAPDEVLKSLRGEGEDLYQEAELQLLQDLAERVRWSPIKTHLEQVNHPEISTCYPPLTEFAFALSARLAPGDEVAWKALVALLDFLVCVLVLLMLQRLGRDPAWVLFYAWCPLPVKEYANTGHFDPLATLFTVLAVYLLMDRRSIAGGLALGAGISAKLYPLILVPVLWRRLRWKGILASGVVPVLFLAPFLGIGLRLFDGLVAFAKDWEFNSSVFAVVNSYMDSGWLPLLKVTSYLRLSRVEGEVMVGDYFQELVLDGFLLSKVVTAAILLGLLLLLMRWKEDSDWSVPGRAFVALAGLLLLSPVTDPWYLPWLLPYACLFPALSWLYLTGSICCYYAYFLEWKYLWWHRPLEYLPFYTLLLWEVRGLLARHPGLIPGREEPEVVSTGEGADSQHGCAFPVHGSEWL